MNRTSRDTERKVFELYFQGDSHHIIAFKLGLPRSTVSDILGLLPESLIPLRDLSLNLKKQDLTVFEAKKGTQLRARLSDLGVSSDQLQSFVESAEKMRTNPDYEPKQIIQGAMKLSDLEETCGKPYCETLLDFEEKIDNIKGLEMREDQLKEKVKTLETDTKRKLAENNITEKEIAYNVSLREKFRKHSIELNDVENLKKYLENMQETGTDPRTFVQYTKEHGSLNRRTTLLRQEEKEHLLNLQSLKEKEKLAQNTINRSYSVKSKLDKQNDEEQAKLLAVQRETEEIQKKQVQELVKLRQLLNVEAKAEKFTEALAGKEVRLRNLEGEIAEKEARVQSLEQKAQELDNKNKNVEHEIQSKLGIKDYATQLLSALTELQRQQLSLTKENNEKTEKIAVADTVTAFLTKQPDYDFNRFYSYVEQIKTMRESRTYKQASTLQ